MSLALTSPVVGSILISLPITDLVGRDRDPVAGEHRVDDALAGAVGLRDRGQDDLHRLHAVERRSALAGHGRTWSCRRR